MQDRAAVAEECVSQLIRLITNDGEFLASHGYDYLKATEAIMEDFT